LFPSLRVTDVTCTERQCITIDKWYKCLHV
jgi:hypothetical protein